MPPEQPRNDPPVPEKGELRLDVLRKKIIIENRAKLGNARDVLESGAIGIGGRIAESVIRGIRRLTEPQAQNPPADILRDDQPSTQEPLTDIRRNEPQTQNPLTDIRR